MVADWVVAVFSFDVTKSVSLLCIVEAPKFSAEHRTSVRADQGQNTGRKAINVLESGLRISKQGMAVSLATVRPPRRLVEEL